MIMSTWSWEEFVAKHKEELQTGGAGISGMSNQEHRELWKGVPISRDGKVRLRDGTYGRVSSTARLPSDTCIT